MMLFSLLSLFFFLLFRPLYLIDFHRVTSLIIGNLGFIIGNLGLTIGYLGLTIGYLGFIIGYLGLFLLV
jgi:hypothetical protein